MSEKQKTNPNHVESSEGIPNDAAVEQLAQEMEGPETQDSSSGEPTESDQKPLEEQLAEAQKQHLLAVAELDNFRKRTRQATEERMRYACLPLIGDLLESVDNLQRAIDAAEAEGNASGLLDGVKMVMHQLNSVLENHGCRRIEAVGKPFDPNLHQAVQMQPSDEYPPNTVIQELRPGFQLHDRVIRPSQVFVSTGTPDQEQKG